MWKRVRKIAHLHFSHSNKILTFFWFTYTSNIHGSKMFAVFIESCKNKKIIEKLANPVYHLVLGRTVVLWERIEQFCVHCGWFQFFCLAVSLCACQLLWRHFCEVLSYFSKFYTITQRKRVSVMNFSLDLIVLLASECWSV